MYTTLNLGVDAKRTPPSLSFFYLHRLISFVQSFKISRYLFLVALLTICTAMNELKAQTIPVPLPVDPYQIPVPLPVPIIPIATGCANAKSTSLDMDILTPKLGEQYNNGQTINIDWEEWQAAPLWNGRFADRYEIRIIHNGLEIAYQRYTDGGQGSGNKPPTNYAYTIPCDKTGPFLIEVKAFESKLVFRDWRFQRDFRERCRKYSAFVVSPVPVAPTPQVHAVCAAGTYILTVHNPYSADSLKFYTTSNAPKYYKQSKNSQGSFEVEVPIEPNQSINTFLAAYFTKTPACVPMGKESPATPFAVGYLNLDLLTASVAPRDTVLIDHSSSCDLPTTYFVLPPNTEAINKVVDEQLALINFHSGGLVKTELRGPTVQWYAPSCNMADNCKTPVSFNGNTVGEKVCNANLPAGYGTSRTYQQSLSYELHLATYNNNNVFQHSNDGVLKDCNVPLVSQITVAKRIPVPDSDIFILCKEGVQTVNVPKKAGLPPNAGVILEWYTLPTGGTNVNPHIVPKQGGSNNNFGFDFTQDYRVSGDYTYYVGYNFQGKRSKTRAVIRIVVVPQVPMVVRNEVVKKRTPALNNPNEPGTFTILDQDVSAFINYFQAVTAAIPANSPVKVSYSFSAAWTPDGNGVTHHVDVTDPVTQKTIRQKRVDYDNLPAQGGSCRIYTNKITLRFSIKRYDPLTGNSVPVRTTVCEQATQIVTVCKQLYAPERTAHVNCKGPEEAFLITYPNPENYPRMKWYKTLTGSDTVSDVRKINGQDSNNPNADDDNNSFTMQYLYPQGHQIWYVSHVSASGKESARSEAIVVTLPPPPEKVDEEYTVRKPAVAAANDRDAYCTGDNPEPLTFHDLDVDISAYENQVRNILRGLPVSIRAQDTLIAVYWTPAQFISHPTATPEINRVCYGDLSDGEETSRLYIATLKVSFKLAIQDNPTVSSGFINLPINGPDCEVPIRNVTVIKAPPVAGGPVQTCETNFDDPRNTPQYANCTAGIERVAACPNTQYVIGPQTPPVSGASYTWNPTNGLSNAYIKNPTLSYNGLSQGVGATKKYTLTITQPGGNQIWCAMVYKCNACEGARSAVADDVPETDVLLTNTAQPVFTLYPNPAHNDVHIVYTAADRDAEVAEVLVFDIMGRIVARRVLPQGVVEQIISTDTFAPGTYYCAVQQGSVLSKRLPLVIIK